MEDPLFLFLIKDIKSSAERFPKAVGSRSMVDKVGVQIRDCSWLSKPKTLTSSGTFRSSRLSPAMAPIAWLSEVQMMPSTLFPFLT